MDNIKVYIIAQAVPQLLRDCHVNGINLVMITRGCYRIDNTPKGRTALQMVRMNHGLQSIKIA